MIKKTVFGGLWGEGLSYKSCTIEKRKNTIITAFNQNNTVKFNI